MNLVYQGNKILIVGVSGAGKSTFALRYLLADQSQQFIFDHRAEFTERLRLPACRSFEELQTAVDQRRRVIMFDPCEEFTGDLWGAFDFFTNWTFQIADALPGRKLLVADELQAIIDNHKPLPWGMAATVEMGRKAQLDFLGCSLSYNEIHNVIRTQATEIVAFRQGDDLGTAALRSKGFDEAKLANLPLLSYLARDLRTGTETAGAIKF